MNRFGFLCCLAAALFCGAACEKGCPPAADIAPCTCFKNWIVTEITCQNLTESDDLERAFQNSRRYHFTKFILAESTLQYVPGSIFDEVKVDHIDFENVTIMRAFDQISDDAGATMMSFTRVTLLSGWDWKKFSAFEHLEFIEMKDISLKRLSTDFTRSVTKSLIDLHLEACQFTKLRDDQFAKFPVLRRLFVNNNKITTIKGSMFPKTLEEMNFEFNQISSLPEDLFANTPNLRIVSLMGNMISVLPENTFKPLIDQGLGKLDVRNNPIKCDCLLVWLLPERRYINLSGTCSSPKRLFDKRLDFLRIEDFNC